MENIIYSKILVPSHEACDGVATMLYITKEVNGWAVIKDSYGETVLLYFVFAWKGQSNAIEWAFDWLARQEQKVSQ